MQWKTTLSFSRRTSSQWQNMQRGKVDINKDINKDLWEDLLSTSSRLVPQPVPQPLGALHPHYDNPKWMFLSPPPFGHLH